MESQAPMIVANAVVKTVMRGDEPLTILNNINITINAQETLAILGPSGSGKSTLLALLAGLDVPTSGSILLHNQDITQLDEDGRARIRADYIGYVFQSFHLLPSLTALENVMLPLELAGNPRAKAQASHWLDRVGLAARSTHTPRQLSGGEQQRVAIARAFAIDPKLLCADEPTGNLDQHTGQTIIELLFELNQDKGATLVMVTHDEQLAKRCQRQLHLVEGHLSAVS